MHVRSLLLPSIVVAALAFTACRPAETPADPSAALPPVSVRLAEVTTSATTATRRLPAVLQAVDRATVATQAMGTVLRANFALGESVTAGQILVELDTPGLHAAVAQARASLDLATRNFQRETGLLDQHAATAETVRTLDDQRRIAAAQLAAATAQLAHATIRAPFDGIISRRLIEPGDLAAPGTPLFTLEGLALEVQVNVPESLPPAANDGPVMVEIDQATFAARVREASASTDPVTHTRQIRLTLDASAPAHAGQFVRVRWPDATASALTVPASAITAFGQMSRVFVAADGHAQLRLVKVGEAQDGHVPVLSGLNAGEQVILNPPAALRDGQALEID